MKGGLTAAMLSNYERGALVPSVATLESIAHNLNFPYEFFLSPSIQLLEDEKAAFRKRTRTSAKARHGVLAAGTLAVEFDRWVRHEKGLMLPEPDVPDFAHLDPEIAAYALREHWGLTDRPVANVLRVLESRGIRIFSLADHCNDVDAFSLWDRDTPYIFLNVGSGKSAERVRFDAAHELGHLVRDRLVGEKTKEVEADADRFGSAFLMPESDLRAVMPDAPGTSDIHKAKKRWGTSAMALTYRCHQLGMISDWVYRSLCMSIGSQGGRSKELDGRQHELSQLWTKVLKVLREEDGIGIHEVGKAMHLNPSDLKALLRGLVLMS